ncbi:MAG TPA: DUF6542 domain-containing protein [Pseudonocardiaceae bacterium]|nr:DUF6542 domain-containing protein [Pseudonocardiaceae bacterium]
MTGTRSRNTAQLRSWGDQALLPDRLGLPWWAAVLCALGFTATGAFADIERLNRLGIVFQACYFLGCLLAVVVVQRKGLFGPMVQPPLILAVAVPGVVLAVGTPLIDGFPPMAITTGFTLAIGIFRLIIQRRPAPRHDL